MTDYTEKYRCQQFFNKNSEVIPCYAKIKIDSLIIKNMSTWDRRITKMSEIEKQDEQAKEKRTTTFWQDIDDFVKSALKNGNTVKMIVDTLFRILLTYLLEELLTKKK